MIFGLFKPFKMIVLYDYFVVFLFHQTSDKRLLRMNGEGIKFLTEFITRSSGSSDPHSRRAEVEPESLLSKFINPEIDCQKFIKKLVQEGERLEGTSVPENWPKRKIILG